MHVRWLKLRLFTRAAALSIRPSTRRPQEPDLYYKKIIRKFIWKGCPKKVSLFYIASQLLATFFFFSFFSYLFFFLHTFISFPNAAGPAYYVLHPQRGKLPFTFCLTYQAFKNREGIVSQTNLAEWFKIWHLWLETNKNMDDLLAEKWRRFDFKMCGVVLF